MLVKSLSRKKGLFRQLIAYMDRGHVEKENMPAITNNLCGLKQEEIIQEFEENAGQLPRRKNGNLLYHEIISFSTKENHVPPEAMQELAETYIQMRAPYQLAYGRIHLSDNPHVHICFSAGDLIGNRAYLSRAKFDQIKKRLEKIQKERFPELSASLCQGELGEDLEREEQGKIAEHGRQTVGQKPDVKEKIKGRLEREAVRRGDKRGKDKAWRPTKRKRARDAIVRALAMDNRKECLLVLRQAGFAFYERGGKVVGVRDRESGKRYRLATLEVDQLFRMAVVRWKEKERGQGLERGRTLDERGRER